MLLVQCMNAHTADAAAVNGLPVHLPACTLERTSETAALNCAHRCALTLAGALQGCAVLLCSAEAGT